MKHHSKLNPNNWNEHIIQRVGIGILIALFLVAVFARCTKESSLNREKVKVSCDFGFTHEQLANNGKGKKPRGPKPRPVDTVVVDPQPPTNSNACILLDFDGHNVTGWGSFYVTHSGLSAADIQWVVDSIAYDYKGFPVTVTTSESVYQSANPYKRTRVVFTYDNEWYGQAGGVAYVNSFTWGDGTECFVFTKLLGYMPKNCAEAGSHEAGHTLGLYHQSKYVDGVKVSDYHDGEGMDYAPIMGVAYYKEGRWHKGTNSYGNYQDDELIINTTLTK